MKPKVILSGIATFAIAIIGYEYAPKFVTKTMNKFTSGGGDQHIMNSMMAQMGIPPLATLIPLTEFSMISVALIGVGIIIYGMISRKKKESNFTKFTKNKTRQKLQDADEMSQDTIDMLKDSLANGEITYEQYQNLRKRVEN